MAKTTFFLWKNSWVLATEYALHGKRLNKRWEGYLGGVCCVMCVCTYTCVSGILGGVFMFARACANVYMLVGWLGGQTIALHGCSARANT